MNMTRGIPASSQIITMEHMLEERDTEIDRLRGLLRNLTLGEIPQDTDLYYGSTELLEQLAEIEHIQWAHWTKYMLDHSTPENIERWKKQSDTPYSELSEAEKDLDRDWARKVINIL